ncbi:hypothetical protein [Paenimyroides ceti]|uniref:hypothetical protein n=1 Tax=Paenimyroides ceti TaxID=395087 RepID=UPI00294FEF92|nr:hypothetical protein [Paenimyroides ceti]
MPNVNSDIGKVFFKNEAKNKHVILSVRFRLTKKNHILKTAYGDIQNELTKRNITVPTKKTSVMRLLPSVHPNYLILLKLETVEVFSKIRSFQKPLLMNSFYVFRKLLIIVSVKMK